MNILDTNIGSSKDNMSSPVHNWYKFTAGFSYKFVDIILEEYKGKTSRYTNLLQAAEQRWWNAKN